MTIPLDTVSGHRIYSRYPGSHPDMVFGHVGVTRLQMSIFCPRVHWTKKGVSGRKPYLPERTNHLSMPGAYRMDPFAFIGLMNDAACGSVRVEENLGNDGVTQSPVTGFPPR